MLSIYIKSYDEGFDTFACSFTDSLSDTCFDSLIPATLLPYIAPHLCDEDAPYSAVGQEFTLHLPEYLGYKA